MVLFLVEVAMESMVHETSGSIGNIIIVVRMMECIDAIGWTMMMISRYSCWILTIRPNIVLVIRISHGIAGEIRLAVLEFYETQCQRLLMITRRTSG